MFYTELFFTIVIWGVGLAVAFTGLCLAFGSVCGLLTPLARGMASISDALDNTVNTWPSFINGDSVLFRLAMSFGVLGAILLVVLALSAIAQAIS